MIGKVEETPMPPHFPWKEFQGLSEDIAIKGFHNLLIVTFLIWETWVKETLFQRL